MTALAWLNDLMQWFARWVPCVVLIHATHRGVLFGPGGRSKLAGPGIVVYWPMTHDLIQVPITTQSIQLSASILPLKDVTMGRQIFPRAVFCTLNVQFSITDAVRAATKILHFHALVSNRAAALCVQAWNCGPMKLEDLSWLEGAKDKLRTEMARYGIEIQSLETAGIGIGVIMKQLSDWSYADNTSGTRPTP